MEILVVIDMQNDFITGALANDSAKAKVETLADYIKKYRGDLIIFTRDTHDAEVYPKTQEGKKLTTPHCIFGTDGWQIENSLWNSAKENKNAKTLVLDKPTFGYGKGFEYLLAGYDVDMITKIEVAGTCTDICVVSNVLALKELFPEVEITVLGYLCAGLTPQKHQAALDVMESCQVNVIR